MTCHIDTRQFEILRGHPSKYYKGIRWFLIDEKKMFQVYAHNWNDAKEQVIRKNPNALSIELLTR
jgi:hypothetical protein